MVTNNLDTARPSQSSRSGPASVGKVSSSSAEDAIPSVAAAVGSRLPDPFSLTSFHSWNVKVVTWLSHEISCFGVSVYYDTHFPLQLQKQQARCAWRLPTAKPSTHTVFWKRNTPSYREGLA